MTDIAAVYNFLEEHYIKHANMGYRFLTSAILLGIENPSLGNKITDLYDEIAKRHSTSRTCVERSIRNSLAGLKMSNKEFIMKAVDKLTVDHFECNDIADKLDILRDRA